MALLERVSALLRANLNELIGRAKDPVKMMHQVVLDMENQLLQVKTQVAIAVADLHILQGKREESAERETEWARKAELALRRGDEPLARAALERSLTSRGVLESFGQQIADQKIQVENLKGAYAKLQAKLVETRPQLELMKVRKRRERGAAAAASPDLVEERFAKIDQEEEIDRIIEELKAKTAKG